MGNDHYVRCRWRYDHVTATDVPEWHCVSVWDTKGRRRWRTEHMRSIDYRTLREAQRWARRYKVECPVGPGPKEALTYPR